MRIFVSVLYLLPFVFWSFLGIQTNFSSGPFQVTSTRRNIVQNQLEPTRANQPKVAITSLRRFSTPYSIQRGADDTTCEAGAFAAGEEAFDFGVLQGLGIAGDSYG